MDTSTFLDMFLDEVGAGWSRAKALRLLDQGQKEILGVDCDLMRIKSDPFFRTQDGVYEYSAATCLFDSKTGQPGAAITGNIRAIRMVYRRESGWAGSQYGTLVPHIEFLYPGSSLYRRARTQFGDVLLAPVDGVDCIESSRNDARVIWDFRSNPGDTEDVWQAVAYRWPTPVLSENVPIEVPEDYQDTVLLYNMLRRTERRQYGRNDYTEAMYRADLKKLRSKYMSAAKETDQVAIPREA